MRRTSIELLAPARDKVTAIEAIRHGADAVYIGAPKYGARVAAGNSVDDIKEVCQYAHLFRAKVYATLNTILYDEELDDACRLAWELHDAGVDALIVQDMALLEMRLPPIALHASTQMDNRGAAQVRWLRDLGFTQVVLARELSLSEIANVHQQVPDVSLEVFVHGSICVSYNGQCYASQHCFRRSANRGECAQFCRLPFDLIDANGSVLRHQRHLLSLRDMNRCADLERLLSAGVSSLKIEGRLKDTSYVKNVVAYYRQRLDEIIARHPDDYCRSSLGCHTFKFEPRLEAVFNRGFTDYFLNGRTDNMCNSLSPKSTGEHIGEVKSVGERCIIVSGVSSFANGDGICFYDPAGVLRGFRVNRVEGNKLFPHEMPIGLQSGTQLYRNYNHRLEMVLLHHSADRKIPLRWELRETDVGFSLQATVSADINVGKEFAHQHEMARTDQHEQIATALMRLGSTPFQSDAVDVTMSDNWFVPLSTLTGWRNEVVCELQEKCRDVKPKVQARKGKTSAPFEGKNVTYLGNVANRLAESFYLKHGATWVVRAMETSPSPTGKTLLMTCRYCILFELGYCLKVGKRSIALPLYLRLSDNRRFSLQFDCKECQMKVYAE